MGDGEKDKEEIEETMKEKWDSDEEDDDGEGKQITRTVRGGGVEVKRSRIPLGSSHTGLFHRFQ